MLIDSHCHIDQFPSPEEIVRRCEKSLIRVVAVTNLPSHFAKSADRLRTHPLISAALGIHPLFAKEGIREIGAFTRMAQHADFIGEIGLDFSRHGLPTKVLQERIFTEVLNAIRDRPRFITLHSRGAEREVLDGLRSYGIRGAVFHWFTGSQAEFESIIEDGHFISLNPAMLSTAGGRSIVANVTRSSVLAESDGPFATIGSRPSSPEDTAAVYRALAYAWKKSSEEVEVQLAENFNRIIENIRR